MLSVADVQTQRKDLAGDGGGAQPGDDLVVAEGAGLEELLHQLLVVLGDHLDQRFAGGVDGGGHLAGNRAFGELAALVGLEEKGLPRNEVDDAAEVLLFADRQLNGNDGAIARFVQRRQRSLQAGAFAVQAVDDDEAWQGELLGRGPDFFGLHHHAADRIDDDQRGVRDVKRGGGVGEEIPHPGRVDQVDLVFVPLGVGEAGRERVLAGDFFFVVVGDGRAIVDLAEAIHHAGIGEHRRCELGLT